VPRNAGSAAISPYSIVSASRKKINESLAIEMPYDSIENNKLST